MIQYDIAPDGTVSGTRRVPAQRPVFQIDPADIAAGQSPSPPEAPSADVRRRDALRRAARAWIEHRKQEQQTTLAAVAARTADAAEAASIVYLPASTLFVDRDPRNHYERPLNEDRVLKIALEFDWALFTPIMVSDRGGERYAIMDGQHHLEAAKLVKGDGVVVPCVVVRDLTINDEARIFDGLNGRMRATPTYAVRFKARLRYEHDAQMIQREATRLGLSLLLDQDRRDEKPGQIAAVATLERIYRTAGQAALRDVLTILHGAWGTVAQGYRASLLEGAFNFLMRYFDVYQQEHLIVALRRNQPDEVISRAEKKAIGLGCGIRGKQLSTAVAFVLHTIYNRGLPEDRVLPAFQISERDTGIVIAAVKRYNRERRHAQTAEKPS